MKGLSSNTPLEKRTIRAFKENGISTISNVMERLEGFWLARLVLLVYNSCDRRKNTYIVAPVDGRVVGAANTTTVAWTRAISWLTLDTSQIDDTVANSEGVAGCPAMGARGVEAEPISSDNGRPLFKGVHIASNVLGSTGMSFSGIGNLVVFQKVWVDFDKLRYDILDSSLDGVRWATRFHFDVPFQVDNGVAFDGRLCTQSLFLLVTL